MTTHPAAIGFAGDGAVSFTPTLVNAAYAAIAVDQSGDHTLVAAVPGKRIRVTSLVLVASGGTNTATLKSGTSTAITGAMDLVSDGQLVWRWLPAGWCETAAGELLNLHLTGANGVAGMLTYDLID